MRHIVLIFHNGEKSWEEFPSKKEATEYMNYLKEQFDDISVSYIHIFFILKTWQSSDR